MHKNIHPGEIKAGLLDAVYYAGTWVTGDCLHLVEMQGAGYLVQYDHIGKGPTHINCNSHLSGSFLCRYLFF